ncbi:cation:dicarboxylase symporter family transporter, partial [Arthrobacter deserti]|nr:cation:dicarboxylase symporter family transporter [Arthrobacter deserti]
EGLDISGVSYDAGTGTEEATGTVAFLLGIIPTTLLSSLTGENILQTLFVALLVGFALQKMGAAGRPVMRAVGHIQALVFRILAMVMWLAPAGASGATPAVVGETGVQAIISLATLMIAFYITCIL